MVLWKFGKPLVWDATCPDTLASSYRAMATRCTGAVAAAAEERKQAKYAYLNHGHSFTPVVIETLGASYWPKVFSFQRIGSQDQTTDRGGQVLSPYLLPCPSVAVQRGNSASVLGSLCV